MKKIALIVAIIIAAFSLAACKETIDNTIPDLTGMSETQIQAALQERNIIVTLDFETTYTPTFEECDSTPLITASGFKINEGNPRRHRIIAVSRDLKRKYKFGTKLRIKGAGKYDGTYTVRDVMNKRYTKRIDILVGKRDKQTKLKKVKVYKLK